MKITYIAITLLILINFTNTKIRFIGLINRIRLFRLRRFFSVSQLARLYLYFNKKTGDLRLSDIQRVIAEGDLSDSQISQSESESSESDSEGSEREGFAFLR